MLEINDDDCNIYISGNDLLVEYKSNNNTIKAVERKFGGKVDTIKGKTCGRCDCLLYIPLTDKH